MQHLLVASLEALLVIAGIVFGISRLFPKIHPGVWLLLALLLFGVWFFLITFAASF